MKVLMASLGLALMACATPAAAQSLGEDRAWQFKTPEKTAVQANNQQLIELKKSGYFDLIGSGGAGGGAFGGGFGALASGANTNNYFQFVDQSTTTNNCSSSGTVGAPITCGGHGGNSVSGTTQNSTGNTNSNTNNVDGNNITPTTTNNVTNNNNRGGTNTSNSTPVTNNNVAPSMMLKPTGGQ